MDEAKLFIRRGLVWGGLVSSVVASYYLGLWQEDETALRAARSAGFTNVEVLDVYRLSSRCPPNTGVEYRVAGNTPQGNLASISFCCKEFPPYNRWCISLR